MIALPAGNILINCYHYLFISACSHFSFPVSVHYRISDCPIFCQCNYQHSLCSLFHLSLFPSLPFSGKVTLLDFSQSFFLHPIFLLSCLSISYYLLVFMTSSTGLHGGVIISTITSQQDGSQPQSGFSVQNLLALSIHALLWVLLLPTTVQKQNMFG